MAHDDRDTKPESGVIAWSVAGSVTSYEIVRTTVDGIEKRSFTVVDGEPVPTGATFIPGPFEG